MSLIRPFAGLRPTPGYAAEVVAPPYDVLNTVEAREQAANKQWSFLHISKPEIDLPEGTDPYSDTVYTKGRENFRRLLNEGILRQDPCPYYYFYRLIMGEHQQTGLVAAANVPDYDNNRIRRHELTRPEKEDDRTHQIDALNAQTGPVFLTYRNNETISRIAATATTQTPAIDITADDGVQHTLWVVDDHSQIATITRTFDAMECLYIADGHHRSAAASRIAAQRQAANPSHRGNEPYNSFLAVIFPDDQLQILDYNRVITDLNGKSVNTFIAAVEEAFTVTPAASAARPTTSGEFGMYLDRHWYRLTIRADRIPHDPVGQLDVSLLQNNLIAPILGIDDPRSTRRIDFVGGIRGLGELERRVNSGEMAVAFALYPTTLPQLMAVADADKMMPPKSTWFEPKLVDGLISHLLD